MGRGALLVFLEVVLGPELGLHLIGLMGEIALPARAEVDMPAPETSAEGLWVLVVLGPQRAGFTGVGCHRL